MTNILNFWKINFAPLSYQWLERKSKVDQSSFFEHFYSGSNFIPHAYPARDKVSFKCLTGWKFIPPVISTESRMKKCITLMCAKLKSNVNELAWLYTWTSQSFGFYIFAIFPNFKIRFKLITNPGFTFDAIIPMSKIKFSIFQPIKRTFRKGEHVR